MTSTYSTLYVHLVFSTKNREPWIAPAIEGRVWNYLGAVAQQHGFHLAQVGGVEDHVHALLRIPPGMSVSRAAQTLKGASSRWIHETFPALREFAWQDGYGAFSVSPSVVTSVTSYIRRQREHHSRQTFVEEFQALLEKHGLGKPPP